MAKTNKNNKSKNSSSKKVTKVTKKVVKTVKSKSKVVKAAAAKTNKVIENRGRPKSVIVFEAGKQFTVKSLSQSTKCSIPTAAKRIKQGIKDNIIQVVDKKIVDSTGKGRPMEYFEFRENTNKKFKLPKFIEPEKKIKKNKSNSNPIIDNSEVFKETKEIIEEVSNTQVPEITTAAKLLAQIPPAVLQKLENKNNSKILVTK